MSSLRLIENLLFDDTVIITASSEDASFPATNLRKHHRSDVWRTSGTFIITASNRYIDMVVSSGGAEKTASLSLGEYTPSELAAEISTKMTSAAADGNTYTASYSQTTGLWTISTNGIFLSLLFSTGSNAANSARNILGFTGYDKTGAITYTSVIISIHTEEYLVFDLGSFTGTPVDSCMIFFEPGIGKTLSENARVKLQANQTNVWDSPSVDVTLSYDSTYETYSHFFSASQSYRYWRLYILDEYNTNLYVEIPKIVLGKSVAITQVPSSGFRHRVIDLSKSEATSYGQMYSDLYPMAKQFEFQFQAFSSSDLELIWQLFNRVGKTTPIGIVLDSQASLFDKDRFCSYCYMASDYDANHKFYSYFDIAVSFREAM